MVEIIKSKVLPILIILAVIVAVALLYHHTDFTLFNPKGVLPPHGPSAPYYGK